MNTVLCLLNTHTAYLQIQYSIVVANQEMLIEHMLQLRKTVGRNKMLAQSVVAFVLVRVNFNKPNTNVTRALQRFLRSL